MGRGIGEFYETLSNGYIYHSNLLGVARAHNDPIEIAVELGVIGFSLISIFFALSIKSGLGTYTRSNEHAQITIILVLCALVGFSINSLVSFPMQSIAPLISIAILSGLLTGMDNIDLDKKKTMIFRVPALKPIAIVIATALTLFFFPMA